MLLHVAATYTALPKDFYPRLIPIWIGAKIARDLRVRRRAATLSEDVHATVESLLNWMEKVCLLMIRNESESVKLMDDIEVATIAAVARQDHQLVGFSDTDLLTTTLLVPNGQRSLKPLRACFFHRFFQEYLTARAVLRADLDARVFPDSVTRWIEVARKDLAT
jgi:hypothetical protein